ncbi:hypothetical protein HanPI659440_Chr02g0091361 [Helianthus annuus]|nr:hypothetical protein HanPI659440_Chr02g0091361 [Helianthus annuus]
MHLCSYDVGQQVKLHQPAYGSVPDQQGFLHRLRLLQLSDRIKLFDIKAGAFRRWPQVPCWSESYQVIMSHC